nr:hypothetical transcript [Hymenolepis microstoma]
MLSHCQENPSTSKEEQYDNAGRTWFISSLLCDECFSDMIEYCSKRILTVALITLVIVASIIFYIEESVNTTLRPPRPSFDIVVPCSEKQSFHFLTSCQLCNNVDRTIDKACKDTGYHVKIVCENAAEDKAKKSNVPTWVACDPESFRDLNSERWNFVLFEFLIGVCGVVSYIFVRRQHKRLDQRLVDRVNRQILASTYLRMSQLVNLENAVVRFILGDTSNLAAIAIHGLLMLRCAWKDAYGSTCNPFSRYLNKRTNLRGLCVSWLFQLVGGFCSLRLSYFWWGLHLSTPHARLQTRRVNIRRIARFRDSEDFLKLGDLQVSLLFGIFVETAVAFSDVILSAAASALLNLWKCLRHHRLQNDDEDFRMAKFVFFTLQQSTGIYIIYLGEVHFDLEYLLKLTTSSMFVFYSGLPLTGAYMNGVNAMIQTWGLGRASNPLHHIIVYWFSPLLGLWAAKKTLEVIHDLFKFWKCHRQMPMNDVIVSEIAAESMENSPNANGNCYLLRLSGLHSQSLRTNLRGLCVSWLFQLVGGFCSLRLSYFWWGLHLSTPHARLQTRRVNIRRIARFRDSEDFLKLGDLQVSLLFGIFVETAVAFSDVILSAAASALLNLWKCLRHHRLQNDDEDFRMAKFVFFTLQQSTGIYIIYLGEVHFDLEYLLKLTTSSMFVFYSGLPLTGAYMNGVNAMIQTWGLGRASNPLHHIIVYWFSPLLGLWAAKKTLEVIHDLFKFWKCHRQMPMNDVIVSEIAAESMENSPNANGNCYLLRLSGLHSQSLSNNHLNEVNLRRSSEYDVLRTRRKGHTATNDSSVVNYGSSDGELRQRRHRSRTRDESVHL